MPVPDTPTRKMIIEFETSRKLPRILSTVFQYHRYQRVKLRLLARAGYLIPNFDSDIRFGPAESQNFNRQSLAFKRDFGIFIRVSRKTHRGTRSLSAYFC